MKTTIDLNKEITETVATYRQAANSSKTAKNKNPFQMIMDRASGQLDLLAKLAPDSPAWTETGWVS